MGGIMKISELIAELQEIQNYRGDLEVMCWPYDGQGREYPVVSVDVVMEAGKPRVFIEPEQ
jgi:hypothetical protein